MRYPPRTAFIALLGLISVGLCLVTGLPAEAQSQRTADRTASSQSADERIRRQTPAQRMNNLLRTANLEQIPAEDAFKWWSSNARIPLVLNWDDLESDGFSRSTPISIDLEMVPCHVVLTMMMRQGRTLRPLVVEITPWYVEVLTRDRALERLETRTYRVRDLLWDVTDRIAREDRESQQDTDSDQSSTRSRRTADPDMRADTLIELITSSIEPDAWRVNGGPATIFYRNGMLVVRAPIYMHNQLEHPRLARPSVVRPEPRREQETARDEAE